MEFSQEEEIQVLYKNYKGEILTRTIVPIKMLFTSTAWHPKKQWCLLAYDIDKEQERYFAFCDIHAIWTKEAKLAEKS